MHIENKGALAVHYIHFTFNSYNKDTSSHVKQQSYWKIRLIMCIHAESQWIRISQYLDLQVQRHKNQTNNNIKPEYY